MEFWLLELLQGSVYIWGCMCLVGLRPVSRAHRSVQGSSAAKLPSCQAAKLSSFRPA